MFLLHARSFAIRSAEELALAQAKNERSKTSVQRLVLAVRRARARARKVISVKSIMVKQVLVHRIGFRRTRTQRSGTQ